MTDIDTIRALNSAARGHASHKVRYGRAGGGWGQSPTIYCGRPNLPYGQSTQTRAYLSHIPTAIYTAWRKGAVVAQMARWRCGGTSRSFTLGLNPAYRLCHLCASLSGGRQTGVVVTVWSAS